jgi:DNA-binding transcriptional regulator GbsR (MarR family)
MSKTTDVRKLSETRDLFITQWGALGTQWGINRTMAMIHALLLVSPEPLTTDEVMERLAISRGNANTNLRDLTGWGLIRVVMRKGDRRDFYEAEKDVWRMFCIIARERKRRETEPALAILRQCAETSGELSGAEAKELHTRLTELGEFVALANTVMDKVAAAKDSTIVPKILKLLG